MSMIRSITTARLVADQTNTAEAVERRPNPGSEAARHMGCTCPVLDNAHGAEWMGFTRGYYITEGCPVHDAARVLTEGVKHG